MNLDSCYYIDTRCNYIMIRKGKVISDFLGLTAPNILSDEGKKSEIILRCKKKNGKNYFIAPWFLSEEEVSEDLTVILKKYIETVKLYNEK